MFPVFLIVALVAWLAIGAATATGARDRAVTRSTRRSARAPPAAPSWNHVGAPQRPMDSRRHRNTRARAERRKGRATVPAG
jgi:hypothetical protein